MTTVARRIPRLERVDQDWLGSYLSLAFVLVLTAALYVPMLSHWFMSDDFLFLNAFQDASPASYVRDAFDFRQAPPAPELRFYRPFHSGAFLALYEIFGLRAWGFHLWSLAVHMANTVLVWLVGARLSGRPLVGGLAAVFFALHPAHASAVVWISNNNALMATCASLASFWCFLQAQESARRRHLWHAGSVAAYGVSLLFHPEAGPLLLALAGYRALVQMESWREALDWRRWLDLVPFIATAGVYFGIHRWMASHAFLPQSILYSIGAGMLKVYLGYFAVSAYSDPSEPRALPAPRYAVAAVVVVVSMVLLLARTRRRPYLAIFAVFWYLTALAPLTTDWFGSAWVRKLYVAGPALSFLLALLAAPVIELLMNRSSPVARAAAVAPALLLLSLAGWAIVDRQHQMGEQPGEAQRFASRLREAHPTIPEGSRLYVLGLPKSLVLLNISSPEYVRSLVGLYYDGIDVQVSSKWRLPAHLEPGDVVFRDVEEASAAQGAAPRAPLPRFRRGPGRRAR